MNSFETITGYITKAVDTYLATESCTRLLERGDKFIDLNFNGKGEVRIYDLLLDGLADYKRAGSATDGEGYSNYNGNSHGDGYKIGNATGHWTTYSLRYDRGRQFQIDSSDNEETDGLIIANTLLEFISTKVVPEKDETTFSAIAERTFVSLGNQVTETPTSAKGAANLLDLWEKGFAWLTNHGVPSNDQVIYISASTSYLLNTNENLSRFITQADFRSERGVTFHLRSYGGRPIEVVPDDRFYTDVIVDDNGYHASANSKAINYMIVSKKSVLPITKVEKSKVFKPEDVQDFDGYKVNFRLYHDTIVPKNKVVGCYCSIGAAAGSTVANVLSLALKAGSVANSFAVEGVYTTPAGIRGNLLMNPSAAFAVGTKYNAGGSIVSVPTDGSSVTVASATNDAYFALVASDGTAVAVSNGKIALGKKAG